MAQSTIKQKADAEAARAEAENPDAPEAQPSEPAAPETEPVNPDAEPSEEEQEAEEQEQAEEQQAAPPSGRTDEQTQKMFDRAVNAFRAKLLDVFEVDEIQPAQAPGVIGFVLPGFSEQKTHENFQRCPVCNGWGRVLTGSIREGEQTADCPDTRCRGRGYWQKATVPPPQPVAQPVATVTGPTVYEQPAANGSDEWESPAWMGDPSLTSGQ